MIYRNQHGPLANPTRELREILDTLEKKSEEQRLLLDNIKTQVWYLSDTGTYGRVNWAHADFLGFHPREIAYRKLEDFLSPDVSAVCRQSNQEVFDKKKPVCTEEWMPNARGENRLIEIIKTPKIDTFGHVEFVVCSGVDITEQRQAELALKKSEKKYRNLVNRMTDMVYIFSDKHGGLFFSPSVETLLGYTREHLLAHPFLWNESIHPEDRADISRVTADAGSGRPFDVEYRIRDARGNWLWLHDRSISENRSSGETVISGVARDITERKQLQACVRHLQKTQSLGRMAGAVAHHYNNMMAIVVGYLELALDDLSGDTVLVKKLSEALHAAHRASSMGHRMLAYIGNTGGPATRLMDISRICRDCLSDLGKKIGAGVLLETRLPDPGPEIFANDGQVREVLENLVTNARESMADLTPPHRIEIELHEVHSSAIPLVHRYPMDFHPTADAYACIKVMDQGTGIPDADVENIFDPFYSSRFLGRGLGLALTLSMVKAHDGCITVGKGPGQGTVFQVFFPVKSHSAPLE
jgi:PAS domain S-box-containing protein